MQYLAASHEVDFTAATSDAMVDIVNMSSGTPEDNEWKIAYDRGSTIGTLAIYWAVRRKNCLIVTSAGNSGSRMGFGQFSAKLMAHDPHTQKCFINSLALDQDGLHLARFTNQPGRDRVL